MRPYRGKRKDNGEWVYGWLQIWTEDDAHFININEDGYEVIPSTVGQQIGLKDGKGVYVGDIIKLGEFHTYPITIYDFHGYRVMFGPDQLTRYVLQTGEIIGTIHDEVKDDS